MGKTGEKEKEKEKEKEEEEENEKEEEKVEEEEEEEEEKVEEEEEEEDGRAISKTSLRRHIPYTGNCTDELVRMMLRGWLIAVQVYCPASMFCTEEMRRLPLLATVNLLSVMGEESFSHCTTAGGTLLGGAQSIRPGRPSTPNVFDGSN